jgi:hypothetical protein
MRGRAVQFSRVEITASTVRQRTRVGFVVGLNIVSGIVKLHSYQLTIATWSKIAWLRQRAQFPSFET